MATADNVKSKIQSLINKANETTGKSDTDLTKAVKSLVAGYGQGGGTEFPLDKYFEGGYAEVTLPNATKIKASGFINDTALTDISIPKATSIGNSAFNGCTNLARISMPKITSIGNRVFYGCYYLALAELPSGVTKIGEYAFYNCYRLSLTELPSGITEISDSSFRFCSELKLTKLPSGVTKIGEYAFNGCTGISSIELPSGLKTIGAGAFYNCDFLKSITVHATTPPTIQSTTLISVPSDCVIYVPAESVNTYKAATNWSARADYIYPIGYVAPTVEMVTISVDSNNIGVIGTYQAPKGMYWGDYLNSEYAPTYTTADGTLPTFTVDANGIHYEGDMYPLYTNKACSEKLSESMLISGDTTIYMYYHGSGGGAN